MPLTELVSDCVNASPVAVSKWNIQATFFMAVKNNRVDIVHSLLDEYSVDVDTRFGNHEQPAVALAVENGHAEMLKCLLSYGCSVNMADSNGETPLHRAVNDKRLDLMRLLLAERAKTDIRNKTSGSTPLHFAVDTGRLDVVESLTSLADDARRGVNRVDIRGFTPLLLACAKGFNAIAQHLINECNADINVKENISGDTPLHFLLKMTQSTVLLLLKHGAAPNAVNYFGLSPLHVVALTKNVSDEEDATKVEHMIKYGATLESRDKFLRTPLHLALSVDNAFWIRQFLRFNASIESKDRYGRSPLYYAAKSNRISLIYMLLSFSNSRLSSERWIASPTQSDDDIQPETVSFLRHYKRNLPNSLKFLSRCRLRRSFDDSQLRQLVLPSHLFSYVLLDQVF